MAASSKRDNSPHSGWAEGTSLTTILGFAASETDGKPVRPLFNPERVFDVCHVGLIMRAVLAVQGFLALGLALSSHDAVQWAQRMASGTVVTMSAVLLWLVLICAFRKPLAQLSESWQWAIVMALGGGSASLGWQLLTLASFEPTAPFRLVSIAVAGAVTAGILMIWLKLREHSQRPADAMARLVELQARIRPHFLFNTLNSAIALVRLDPQRAEAVLEDLAELFRVALADAKAAVSLDEEIELAQRYLAIEQIRFGDRLRVVWTLDPTVGLTRVPPLLLQPLVENAVRHGVEPNDEGGEIEVLTARRGTEVEIRVVNTVGLPSATSGHGLALRNVRQRLRLMHDVAARFDLHPEARRFTVRILLPKS